MPEFIVHEQVPENAEIPLSQQPGWVTPPPLFFRRNHFPYPQVDAATWRLEVTGGLRRPLRLSLGQLRAMAQGREWATIECSGNKRSYFEPPAEGTPWREGAIGNAEWAGVPLRHLLRLAGVRPGALEVAFYGADSFARSLPLAEALRPEVLLAITMNGEGLPAKHGAPVRLVVPDWYAMASVKWLTRIEIRLAPFRGPYQVRDYVYLPRPGAYDQAVPVTRWKVNSAVVRPPDGARVAPGPLLVCGAAWGGTGPLRRVEVSLDGGRRWAEATWLGPAVPHTWRLWQWMTPPLGPGHYRIASRAVDGSGEIQPARAPWNAKGYGNNAIHPVTVTVASPAGEYPSFGEVSPELPVRK